MGSTETLIEKLDQLQGKAIYFIITMGFMGFLLVGSSVVAWQSSREQQRLALAHTQTLMILGAAGAVRVGTLDMLRGERGYLLTGDSAHLETYARGRKRLTEGFAQLRRQARDRNEREVVARLDRSVEAYVREVDAIVALARSGGMQAAREQVQRSGGRDGAAPIATEVERFIDSGKAYLYVLKRDVERASTALLRFVYLMSAAGLFLLALAVISAIALRRSYVGERAYRAELRKRAETDDLTGVANRRELLTYLDRRVAESRRTGAPLSFAMFDIDNFKRVNDGYGHGVGDEVIRYVVRTAQKVVRINDRIGRLGGEEFGIVLPKSSQESAVAVCERLGQRLRDEGFAIGQEQALQVTISSGIACLTEADDAASLMKRADQALYEAKRSGRDTVKLAA